MLPTTCDLCALKFNAPLHLAGKTVKCPKCSAPITIATLFDDAPEPATPAPPKPATAAIGRPVRPDPTASRPRSGQSAPQAAGNGFAKGVSLCVLAIAVGLTAYWCWPEAKRRQRPDSETATESAAADGAAAAAPAAEAPPAPVAAKPAVKAPPPPTLTHGIDLLGPEGRAHAIFFNMIFTGSRLRLVAVPGKSTLTNSWPLAPTGAGSWMLTADICMVPTAGNTLFLGAIIPGQRDSQRFSILWPTDGRMHRFACWPGPAGAIHASVDGEAVELMPPGVTSDTGTRAVELYSPYVDAGEITQARLYSEASWEDISAQRGKGPDGGKAIPVPLAELRGSAPFQPGVFTPFDPGPLEIPVALENPTYADNQASHMADFAYRGVRPQTQAELDLAARILWVAVTLSPKNAEAAAVIAELARPADQRRPGPLTAFPAHHPSENAPWEGARPLGLNVPQPLYAQRQNLLQYAISDLCNFMAPGGPMFGMTDPRPDAGRELDWRFLARAQVGDLDEDIWSLDRERDWGAPFVCLVRPPPDAPPSVDRNYLLSAGAVGYRAALRLPDGTPSYAPSLLTYVRISANETTELENVRLVSPGRFLWADGGVALEATGSGTISFLPVGDPFAPALATCEIDVPERAGRSVDVHELNPRPLFTMSGAALRVAWMGTTAIPGNAAGADDRAQDPPKERPLLPVRFWLERSGAKITWTRTDTQGRTTTGSAESPLPLQATFLPAKGRYLAVLQFAIRQPPAKAPTDPLDSLRPKPAAFVQPERRQPRPPPPAAAGDAAIEGISQSVFEAGRDEEAIIYLSNEPPEEVRSLWFIDETWNYLRAGRTTALDVIPDPKDKARRITREVPVPPERKQDDSVRLGFKVALGTRVASLDGAASQPTVAEKARVGYSIKFKPGWSGTFRILLESSVRQGAIFTQASPITVSILPRRPATQAQPPPMRLGDIDRDGRMTGNDHPLITLLMLRAGAWLPGQEWQPPPPAGRPAKQPGVIVPQVTVSPAEPDDDPPAAPQEK